MTPRKQQRLGFTALYTSQAWIRGGLPEAELFDVPDARPFFRVVTGFYEVARRLRPGMKPILTALLHRHRMIDHLLEQEAAPQVLELAAGLSPRGAWYSRDESLRYTEVDLPPVIEAKRRILSRSARGRAVAERSNLRFVAGDVTRLALEPLLDPGQPAFVTAEGLHMYLPVDVQQRLWERVAAALGREAGGVFVFDHFQDSPSERPGRLSRAVLALVRRWQRRIGFVDDRRSHADVARDLERAGFDEVEQWSARELARAWDLPHPHVETDVVILLARKRAANVNPHS
jgi:O-methyltransferase involved in polyketide biosynthesis